MPLVLRSHACTNRAIRLCRFTLRRSPGLRPGPVGPGRSRRHESSAPRLVSRRAGGRSSAHSRLFSRLPAWSVPVPFV
jgi:hypothetical protein